MFEHVWAIFNTVSETQWSYGSYGTQNEIQFSGVTSPKFIVCLCFALQILPQCFDIMAQLEHCLCQTWFWTGWLAPTKDPRPIHHRQLTSNSLTTPSTAPAANRWMDSLSPVRPPQPWPPYEPGRAIQKASKCRMLGIVKLGTFNQFSGCGYGALTGPLWICASATAWATMLRSNSWAASNQSQRQVPSNGRPFEKFLFEMFEIKSLSCVKAFVRVVERSIVRARSSLEVPDFQKQFGTTSAELKLDEA